jgi:hypothetical protein
VEETDLNFAASATEGAHAYHTALTAVIAESRADLDEESRRRVDSRGGYHARSGVPRDQQGRTCLERRHVAAVDVVRAAAARAGIDKLAAHDLRRTCARLCTSRAANWIRSSSCSATPGLDFSDLPLDRAAPCPKRVPPWIPPRSDLFGPPE